MWASFTLYPRGKSPRYTLDKGLGGPQSRITLINKITQGAYKKKATRVKHLTPPPPPTTTTTTNALDLTGKGVNQWTTAQQFGGFWRLVRRTASANGNKITLKQTMDSLMSMFGRQPQQDRKVYNGYPHRYKWRANIMPFNLLTKRKCR
jgi:hypothetical protein